jgi:hypothetical protein
VEFSRLHSVVIASSCPEIHDPRAALDAARGAVRSRPRLAEAHEALGLALLREGSAAEAKAALVAALGLQVKPAASSLFALALAEGRLGAVTEGRAILRRGVERLQATYPADPESDLLRREAEQALGLAPVGRTVTR